MCSGGLYVYIPNFKGRGEVAQWNGSEKMRKIGLCAITALICVNKMRIFDDKSKKYLFGYSKAL